MSVRADSKGGVVVSNGPNGNVPVSSGPDGIHYEFSRMTMSAFAGALSQIANQPVIDMTELKGTCQLALDIPMAEVMKAARSAGFSVSGGAGMGDAANSPADAASEPSGGGIPIFESVQKLGLRLEQRKAPMEMIVVDHLERSPTDN